jgi:L-lactate dehydrogenase (cytochrome)
LVSALLYLVGGRDVAERAIARPTAASYDALVLTIDTPVAGMRLRDQRNG